MQTEVAPREPLRFYHLILQPDLLGGWLVIREWGYQGSRGRSRRDHYPDRDEAQEAMIRQRDSQLARGYRVVFMEGGSRA